MKITEQTKYTLDENEIKIAIRKHLIDKLGTEPNINEKDIELEANVDRDGNVCDYVAVATVTKQTDTDDAALDTELIDLMNAGTKLQAVKLKRDRSGFGLKESKEYCDALELKHCKRNR